MTPKGEAEAADEAELRARVEYAAGQLTRARAERVRANDAARAAEAEYEAARKALMVVTKPRPLGMPFSDPAVRR
jgi:predicted RNA-binding protein associated with RNAse of E/G family